MNNYLACPRCGQLHLKPQLATLDRSQCRKCGAVPLRAAWAEEMASAHESVILPAGIYLEGWERQQVTDTLQGTGILATSGDLDVVAAIPALWSGRSGDHGLVLVRVAARLHLVTLHPFATGRDAAAVRDTSFLRERLAAYGEVRRLTEAVLHLLDAQGRLGGDAPPSMPQGTASAGREGGNPWSLC